MHQFDIGDVFCDDMEFHELSGDIKNSFSILPESSFQLNFDAALDLFMHITKHQRQRSPHFSNKVGYVVSIKEVYQDPEDIHSILIIYYYDCVWWICTVVKNNILQPPPGYSLADKSNWKLHD